MIGYIEHHIVDHCNLNCKGCSHFVPLASKWEEDLETFTKDFTQLRDLTGGQIDVIRLMGGEPLLHPQLVSFVEITRKLFPNSQIQVVTNGILLKKRTEELAPVFNAKGIIVCVSNYGLNLDLNEITKDFKYKIVHWKNQLYHIGLKREPVKILQGINSNFECCDIHKGRWYYFQNGNIYHCCIGANIHHLNATGENFPESYGICIYEHTLQEVEDYLSKPNELCGYCDTLYRSKAYNNFDISKKEKSEWICQ